MIDKKYERYVFAFLMGTIMSFIMSFIISFINLGLIDGFFVKWMEAFFKAAVCAIPIISIVAPRVKRVVERIVRD
ncbi:DUF2798 domain-containing membrane protein [Aliarcobacter faecis]|uniref:DUF2798 domain-containing protein n=1 Tax=Aliarcobacter faecis TaxID=1564138 RepID=UPI00047C4C83|nr:DUF2798 domain-containing protein [Aliarcobacter faecis]QKF73772.1 DUF2798 domain-containing membrane protein [Aliarcobacter faecis]